MVGWGLVRAVVIAGVVLGCGVVGCKSGGTQAGDAGEVASPAAATG